MGDINVSVAKNVDLTKLVNKDIFKQVTVDVNNNDILAEAEGDAEAFGPNALAQVDVFTFVRQENGDGGVIELFPGAVDADGNTGNFELSDATNNLMDVPILPDPDPMTPPNPPTGDFTVPNTVTIPFATKGQESPEGEIIPDVNDVNGSGKLNLFPPPDGENALPALGNPNPSDPGLSFDINPDMILTITDDPGVTNPAVVFDGDLQVIYDLQGNLVIDFGQRTIDTQPGEQGDPCDNCGEEVTANLTLTIPDDTDFQVTYENAADPITAIPNPDFNAFDTPIEIEFLRFDATEAFFTFDGQIWNVNDFVMELESIQDLNLGLSDWQFQANTDIPMCVGCDNGDGEAFAYAESIAAIDLNSSIP